MLESSEGEGNGIGPKPGHAARPWLCDSSSSQCKMYGPNGGGGNEPNDGGVYGLMTLAETGTVIVGDEFANSGVSAFGVDGFGLPNNRRGDDEEVGRHSLCIGPLLRLPPLSLPFPDPDEEEDDPLVRRSFDITHLSGRPRTLFLLRCRFSSYAPASSRDR